jgi:hypothetical protein
LPGVVWFYLVWFYLVWIRVVWNCRLDDERF